MTPRPIEIIGGGLAGLALGCALRREGVEVTLHEAGDYPRHRVCGEFIAGLRPATIARLGLGPMLAGAIEHRRVAWFLRNAPPHSHTLPAPAIALSRFALDARLAATFTALGGDLRLRSRVAAVEPRAGRVFATGRRRQTASPWLGLKLHAHGLSLAQDLEMHLGENCYVGLARIEDGGVNVCGLFRRGLAAGTGATLLLNCLRAAGLAALADRIARARIDPASVCAVAGVAFDRRPPPTTRLCLGDTLAMIPPFTGNGMAMAFQSAELALAPLLAYARGTAPWAEALRAAQRAQRNKFRMRLVSADALHPFLLGRRRQRWLAALGRARLLPFRPLFAALH
ncbi:MAG: NAD(P)-binding protein [Opitutaceae bacterium]|nr:NAD(P)-binding protein [Opitutaceae bacterium]